MEIFVLCVLAVVSCIFTFFTFTDMHEQRRPSITGVIVSLACAIATVFQFIDVFDNFK